MKAFSNSSAEISRTSEKQKARRSSRGESAHQEHGEGGGFYHRFNLSYFHPHTFDCLSQRCHFKINCSL